MVAGGGVSVGQKALKILNFKVYSFGFDPISISLIHQSTSITL